MKNLIATIKYAAVMLAAPKGVELRPPNIAVPQKAPSFYEFKMKANNGKEIDFSSFKGKTVLLVNVASKCGYTPQYKELEKLHQQYKDKLIILGFPADNFGHQEPGSDEQIAEFCEINFGVTFQLFQKSSVRGKDQNPVFYWLSHKDQNGWNDKAPSWNFCKYLVNEKGELIAFFNSSISPLSDDIVKHLK
jgi:glutathione peroxidase